MKYWALSVFVGLFSFTISSHATVTLAAEPSGVSGLDLTDPASPIIYVGFTSCVGDGGTNTSTCDSCTGAPQAITNSKLWTCNKKSAYPNLNLIIRVTSTTAGANATNAIVTLGGEKFTPTTTPTFADGILTVQLPWSEICNHSEVGAGVNCQNGDFAKDLGVGFEVTANGSTTTDVLTFKLRARVAKTDNSDQYYVDCETADATINSGACHFSAYPGDEKLYADNFSVANGYPATGTAGISYTGVVFFYEQQQSGETDAVTRNRISNASPSVVLTVNTAASPPIADNRITGLTNEVRYCMVMANQDATGNISYFTPTSVSETSLCGTPSEVVGLLDDKSCFIATAAFGSNMASEVQSLRDFRNKFLLPFSWGRAFVKFYYKYSPFYANLISENEIAKSIVRGVLWPILFFARMSVNLGFWISFIMISTVFLLFYSVNRRWIFKKRFRG